MLAQRAAYEGPRWTRAAGNSFEPSWDNVHEQARKGYLGALAAAELDGLF